MSTPSPRTWFITGVSSGIGRATAQAALGRGERVIGTLRQAAQCDNFEALQPGRAHAVLLDVSDAVRVTQVVDAAFAAHGRIDVIVNNAGFVLLGSTEEIAHDEARRLFDTNFFGLLSVTRACLPHLRRQGGGHIINVSSTVGLCGTTPGTPLYAASKFAVEGLSESLQAEVMGLGIRVTVIEPGAVNSSFAANAVEARRRLPEVYSMQSGGGGIDRHGLQHFYGAAAADTGPTVTAILAAVDVAQPPLRMLAGAEAVAAARAKAEQLTAAVAEAEARLTQTGGA
jgi:NAD(P)-dependent dehydrogenase (short-subunit alcohol dehydrogenase family)